MSDKATFGTGDLFDLFRRQGHNRRTKGAWETGIAARATGRGPYYENSTDDYRRAYRAGWAAADHLIRQGRRWKCERCDALHPQEDP